MNKKRSQVEMLGLVMIVAFISLAMLFVVRFVIMREPEDIRAEYQHGQLANNIISSMLAVNVKECSYSNIRDLLIDCVEAGGGTGSIRCDGSSSCVKANETIELILNETLKEWGNKYEFDVYKVDGNKVTSFNNGKCLGKRKPALYPFETSVGTMFVRIYVCS